MYDYQNDNSIPQESREHMDLPKIEHAVRDILEAIGEDLTGKVLLRHLSVLQECTQRFFPGFIMTCPKTSRFSMRRAMMR